MPSLERSASKPASDQNVGDANEIQLEKLLLSGAAIYSFTCLFEEMNEFHQE
jgi:hypothetical protein